jgi:DNA topoisomerase-3
MRLIIAEKPSVARELAAVIGGGGKRRDGSEFYLAPRTADGTDVGASESRGVRRKKLPDADAARVGYIECGSGITVSWCLGHLLEQRSPESYVASGKLVAADLPVVPEEWKLAPRDEVAACQFAVLAGLLKRAKEVVHAGDADREGQLLVEEVLVEAGWRGKTQRLWLSALDDESVKLAWAKVKSNEQYLKLYLAGLGRQRADWLMSLQGSYAMTQRLGALWPIGRVQSAALALIVDRQREIENFTQRDHYTVHARLGEGITAGWQIPQDLLIDGLLLDRAPAEACAATVSGRDARVEKFTAKRGERAAPLPFSLSALQKLASRRLKMRVAAVDRAAQALYEAKVTTYPRTDCQYLPEEQIADAARILTAINGGVLPTGADPSRRHRAWNSKKVSAHHAIIPTGQPLPVGIDPDARRVYELIRESYIRLFMGPETFEQREAIFVAPHGGMTASGGTTAHGGAPHPGERFKATAKIVEEKGWTALGDDDDKEEGDKEGAAPGLPVLKEGQVLRCASAEVVAKRTEPPKRYTDGTLIEAMKGIHKYVTDPKLKSRLKETSGIGTEATRSAIIKGLEQRAYIEQKAEKKVEALYATERGCTLVDSLRAMRVPLVDPGYTALQEDALAEIESGQRTFEDFYAEAVTAARSIIETILNARGETIPGAAAMSVCPGCGEKRCVARVSKKGWPHHKCLVCESMFVDENGAPGRKFDPEAAKESDGAATPGNGPKCPKCKSPTHQKKTRNGYDYYFCGGCKGSWWPNREDVGKLGPKWDARK